MVNDVKQTHDVQYLLQLVRRHLLFVFLMFNKLFLEMLHMLYGHVFVMPNSCFSRWIY